MNGCGRRARFSFGLEKPQHMSRKARFEDYEADEFEERVIHIDRVKKTVKGGQIISFRALVAVGNKKGVVGFAVGKARGTPDAIRKGVERAKKSLVQVPLSGTTLPHEVTARVGGATVFMRPASRGTGVIAGGPVRPIVELAGVHDVLAKCLGSESRLNNAAAAFDALRAVRNPEEVAELRGKTTDEVLAWS